MDTGAEGGEGDEEDEGADEAEGAEGADLRKVSRKKLLLFWILSK